MTASSRTAPVRFFCPFASLLAVLTVLAAVALAVPLDAAAQGGDQSQQDDNPPQTVIAQIEYMAVPPDQSAEYLSIEREIWKPIHQERVDDGTILGWHLYMVRYPGGTGHGYNFATVTYVDSVDYVEDPSFETYTQRVHGEADLDVAMQRTYDARKLVRSELWIRHDAALPEGRSSAPPPFLRMDYMKVAPGEGAAYMSLERSTFKPVHRARVSAGAIEGWTVWEMVLPAGSSQPHNFATMTGYASMSGLPGSYPEGVWEQVHPDRSTDEIFEQMYGARDLVQTELWELVESVSDKSAAATSSRQ
jgi:hypothetical protein